MARLVYGTTAPPCNFSHSAAINVTELVLLLTQEVEELLDCCPRGPVAIALQLKPARFFWQLPLAKVVWKGLNKDSWHPAHERTADNPPPPLHKVEGTCNASDRPPPRKVSITMSTEGSEAMQVSVFRNSFPDQGSPLQSTTRPNMPSPLPSLSPSLAWTEEPSVFDQEFCSSQVHKTSLAQNSSRRPWQHLRLHLNN